MNVVESAVALTVVAGSLVGGSLYIEGQHKKLDSDHVHSSDFSQHLSEQRVQTIFSYMDQIAKSGPQDWLCRALHQEFLTLCTELPDHAMCEDRNEIIDEAGC